MTGQARPSGKVYFVSPFDITIIGLDTDHGEGDHPLWDERIELPVDENLIKNIQTYGVSSAVKVRVNGQDEEGNDVFEAIDGRQRVRACREAYKRAEAAGEVPPLCKIEIERAEDLTHVGLMISLNEQRKDDTPMSRAKKAFRATQMGHSTENVATMFGVTTNAVYTWLKVVDLHIDVQHAVDSGDISFTTALAFHGLPRGEQQEKLHALMRSGVKPTRDEAEAVVSSKESRPRAASSRKNILTKKKLERLEEDADWFEGLSEDAQALFRVFRGDSTAVDDVPGLAERIGR